MRTIALLCLVVLVGCNKTKNDPNHSAVEPINRQSVEEDSATVALFDRWEKVWRDGEYDLIASCVADKYIRHDIKGERVVTREEYEQEIKQTREALPDIKFIVYDNSFSKNEAWLRYTMTYTSPETNEMVTRKGIQVYRIVHGKLAETWMTMLEPGTKWLDSTALKCWSCSE
ncbi:MAG: nuclear transport factor 2 family protein [Flavobacteriaceae bacterium]|nr:nuclear transport factor 2 family protein [Mangrovimonas sp.]MCB0439267.1 nuclear transport factor 2 family protein [Mangrovimonas sp.]